MRLIDIDYIKNFILLSRDKSMIVDIARLKEYPNIIRTLTILSKNRVMIEFSLYDKEEFACFIVQYKDFENMIASLEIYMEKDIYNWKNWSSTGEYVDESPEIDKLALAQNDVSLFMKNLNLPSGGIVTKNM